MVNLKRIGVLALQGDFLKHAQMVEKCGYSVEWVKTKEHLQKSDALIIPGGESTAFLHLIEKNDLRHSLETFAKTKPLFGTCAGLIVLAKKSEKLPFDSLNLIEVEIQRNAYGRQIDSFVDTVYVELSSKEQAFEGVFIRAPKIIKLGEGVKPIGWRQKEVVMAESENILVSSFHPELTDDIRIHQYFLDNF
jgi:5'-phosphate synthase pdxT subunit